MNSGEKTSAMAQGKEVWSHRDIKRIPGALWLSFIVLILAGCTSIGINTAPDAKIRQKVRWTWEKQAITIHVIPNRNLNLSDKRPHTLIIGIAEISDPNGFLPLLQNPDRAMETLASGKKRSGILAVRRFIISPGTAGDIVLDRMRDAVYLGIIAGYSDYSSKKDIRIRPMPVRVRRSGIIFRSNHFRPAMVSVRLILGPKHLESLQVLDTTRKEKHKKKQPDSPPPAKTPSAIRPL
jgi:type VI secretion system VasD/TssJ family lipoprotein